MSVTGDLLGDSRAGPSDARRRSLLLFALAWIALGAWLPTAWYDALPRSEENLPDPPVKGVVLLKLCFLLEGLGLLPLCLRRSIAHREDATPPPLVPIFVPGAIAETASDLDDVQHPRRWIVLITLLAAGLRVISLNNDLWLDELTTVLAYSEMSPLQIVATYTSSNNHLLNTLLVKLTTALWGPAEWAIRLPAVLSGVACVPAVYLLGRCCLTRREALMASLMLAVSWHHIFFTQNARGYTGYLLWGVLASWCLLRGLAGARRRYWIGYTLCMTLCIATLLYGWFLLAAHAVVVTGLAWSERRQWRRLQPLWTRAAASMAAAGIFAGHLYATALPHVFVYVKQVYNYESVGYPPLSLELWQEFARGLSAGLGGLAGAMLVTAALLFAIAKCWKRSPLVTALLISPLVLMGLFLAVRQLQVSPRFFLWGLPVFPVLAVMALSGVRRSVSTVFVALFCAASAISLPQYYQTPKQPTRTSLAWIRARMQSGDVLVCAYLTEGAAKFYGASLGLNAETNLFFARSLDALRQVESRNPPSTERKVWALTTFPRALRIERPDLVEHLQAHYRAVQSFPATVGDGEMTVWLRRNQL